MVNFALPTLALLALMPVIGAVAVPDSSVTNIARSEAADAPVERFSFAKWVDGIIADPNGTHLTPEQAIEAWERTVVNATTETTTEASRSSSSSNGTLHKRLRCNNIWGGEAPVPDAVQCINHLAGLGTTPCVVQVESRFATYGNAEIWGIGAGTATHSSYWYVLLYFFKSSFFNTSSNCQGG